MNGDLHRSRRRMVMPLFTKSAVERYRNATLAEIERRAGKIVPGAHLDVSAAMTELSLAIALRCLFGLDLAAEGRKVADLSVAYLESLIDPGAMLFPFDLPATPYRRLMRVSADLESNVLALVADKRKASLGDDVLSLLVRARDEDGTAMGDTELVGQVNVFFVAGFETTANTLAWTLFLPSQHPEEADAVIAELDLELGGRAPELEDIPKLAKLDRVVSESMRLLPATPFLFMRRAADSRQHPVTRPAGPGRWDDGVPPRARNRIGIQARIADAIRRAERTGTDRSRAWQYPRARAVAQIAELQR